MYYIYHIPSVKIGCTTNPEVRVEKEQGYTNYEILHQTECIYEASRVEIELQKKFGYSVDITPYYKSYNNRLKGNQTQRNNGHVFTINKQAVNKTSKKINQLDLNGNIIKTHNSMRDALRELNKSVNCIKGISEVCNGKRKTMYGFRWEFTLN